ncbi:hypothetical protein QTP88_014801 [Uroleucon formosanum]
MMSKILYELIVINRIGTIYIIFQKYKTTILTIFMPPIITHYILSIIYLIIFIQKTSSVYTGEITIKDLQSYKCCNKSFKNL